MSEFEKKLIAELENIRNEIDADADRDREHLEGWYKAILWVLTEFRKGI
jgi:hypothetical protein